ncbi:hypothetical protein L6164_030668 [Bauhinia variegata]|uniref:Uncharacterized protein n=1 Tax=Bauhinia variegata TaxID=167791 RepID=A0ACB9LCL8_BAUVA|nr:hypothetical protein L6164_030668 [Bauhinia variegata]
MQAMAGGSSSRGKRRVRGEGEEQVPTNTVKLGDVIYIKIHHGSWWPAQVVDENSVSESNKPSKGSEGEVLVRIYGSSTYLYADPVKSRHQFEEKLKWSKSSKTEIFMQSLEKDLPSSKKASGSSGSGSKTRANVRKNSKESEKQKDVEGSNSKTQEQDKETSNSPEPDSPLIIGVRLLRPRKDRNQGSPSPSANKKDRGKGKGKGKSHKQDEVEKKRQRSPTDNYDNDPSDQPTETAS